jgi:hypothetical protein
MDRCRRRARRSAISDFGPTAVAPALAAPVLAGQKRKLLERYVETRTDRNDPSHPNPNTGADSTHADCNARTRTRSFRASFCW